jgi:hypothetical protein
MKNQTTVHKGILQPKSTFTIACMQCTTLTSFLHWHERFSIATLCSILFLEHNIITRNKVAFWLYHQQFIHMPLVYKQWLKCIWNYSTLFTHTATVRLIIDKWSNNIVTGSVAGVFLCCHGIYQLDSEQYFSLDSVTPTVASAQVKCQYANIWYKLIIWLVNK